MNLLKKIYFLLLILIFSLSQSYSQEKHKWSLSKNKYGIKIYTRITDKSPIKEVMAIMELKTSLSSLVALAKDAKNHHNWIYLNKIAYFLHVPSDFEWYYYNESDAPWPVTNRDVVTHAKLTQDSASYAIRIETNGVPDYIDEKKGIVRIPRLTSSWNFTPKKEGLVLVKFKLFIDLGGTIPAWAINLAVENGPFNTMYGLTKEIQREKYKNAKLSFIKEKPINR
ncbi:MAG: START domain-containing protein [Bacteroidota bacterium]